MSLRRTLGLWMGGAQLFVASIITTQCYLVGAQQVEILPVAAGVLLLSVLGAITIGVVSADPTRTTGPRIAIDLILPRASALLLVSGLGLVGPRPWLGLFAAAIYLAFGEGLGRIIRRAMTDFSPWPTSPGAGSELSEPPVDTPSLFQGDGAAEEPDLEATDAGIDETVDQRITRSMYGDDGDRLHAVMRCRFAAHQRHGTIHIGFCPPFGDVPQISLQAIDGPPARITLGEALAWGARVDVHLLQDLPQPASCLFELVAQTNSVPLP